MDNAVVSVVIVALKDSVVDPTATAQVQWSCSTTQDLGVDAVVSGITETVKEKYLMDTLLLDVPLQRRLNRLNQPRRPAEVQESLHTFQIGRTTLAQMLLKSILQECRIYCMPFSI